MKPDEVATLLRRHRVVDRRRHPELAARIDWLVRTGRLVRVLPSIYAPPEDSNSPEVRILAAAAWDSDAVITGAAAARLTYASEFRVPVVSLASKFRCRSSGFLIARRRIPSELIMEGRGLRCTTPALTALDLCTTHGGDAIDAVLRTKAATLTQLWDALRLTPERPGNLERRRLLIPGIAPPVGQLIDDTRRFGQRVTTAGRIPGSIGRPSGGSGRTRFAGWSCSAGPGGHGGFRRC